MDSKSFAKFERSSEINELLPQGSDISEKQFSGGKTSDNVSEHFQVEQFLSSEQVEKCKSIFHDMTGGNNHEMTREQVGIALRKIGYTPTEEDIQRHVEKAVQHNIGYININQFLHIASLQSQISPISLEQVICALQFFYDADSVAINSQHFFEILIAKGEPIDIADAGRFIAMIDPKKDGKFTIEMFINNLGLGDKKLKTTPEKNKGKKKIAKKIGKKKKM